MWKSKNDSHCVCWPFHPNPPPPPVPWITLALSDDPTETTQTRALWPRKCAFSARGVRRSGWWKVGWEGERLMEGDIFLGEGEAKFWWQGFSCLEQPWHYDIVDSQKHTLARPAQRHVDPVTSSKSSRNLRTASKVSFKHPYSNAGCVKGRESAWDWWM